MPHSAKADFAAGDNTARSFAGVLQQVRIRGFHQCGERSISALTSAPARRLMRAEPVMARIGHDGHRGKHADTVRQIDAHNGNYPATQFSTCNPGTRTNSRSLLVTRIQPGRVGNLLPTRRLIRWAENYPPYPMLLHYLVASQYGRGQQTGLQGNTRAGCRPASSLRSLQCRQR